MRNKGHKGVLLLPCIVIVLACNWHVSPVPTFRLFACIMNLRPHCAMGGCAMCWRAVVQLAEGRGRGGRESHLAGATPQAVFELPPEATFEDYLAAHWAEDDVTEAFLDPLSLKGAPKPMHKASAAHHEVCARFHAAASSFFSRPRRQRICAGASWRDMTLQ